MKTITVIKQLEELDNKGIKYLWKNQKNKHIEIHHCGFLIDFYLGTGTYSNRVTGYKGKGFYNLLSYLEFLKSPKPKQENSMSDLEYASNSSNSIPEESLEVNPYERIDLLEKRLESVLERISELEKYCFKK